MGLSRLPNRNGWEPNGWKEVVNLQESAAYFKANCFPPNFLEVLYSELINNCTWQQPVSSFSNKHVKRKTVWYVRMPCVCPYEYSNLTYKPTRWPDWFETFASRIIIGAGFKDPFFFNACNINYYPDGNHHLYYHADDEELFGADMGWETCILSFSLGAERKFLMRNNESQQEWPCYLAAGDMLIMEGLFQSYFQHSIPRAPGSGPRINITFRTIRFHKRYCPCHAQYGI